MSIAAAILAGGRATRLGGVVKPLVEIGGRRILDRQLDALRPRCEEIILVANDAAPFAPCGLRVVPDLRPGLGPLGGLEAALAATAHAHVLLIAGDLPLLDPRLIALLVEADPDAEAVVPFTARGPEPLCARYARRIRPKVAAALDAGRLAMHRFLDELAALRIEEPALRAIDPSLAFLLNVNTPEDVAAAGARLPHRFAVDAPLVLHPRGLHLPPDLAKLLATAAALLSARFRWKLRVALRGESARLPPDPSKVPPDGSPWKYTPFVIIGETGAVELTPLDATSGEPLPVSGTFQHRATGDDDADINHRTLVRALLDAAAQMGCHVATLPSGYLQLLP